jgi:hypothetical protein
VPTRAEPKSSVNIAAHRVYHVTHVNNLPSILAAGALLAEATPVFDISSAVTRELRASLEVSRGAHVSSFIPFFLTPGATHWSELRSGAVGAHWSAEARAAAPSEFVVLVTDIGTVTATAIIADGDAAGTLTRFAGVSTEFSDAGDRMLRRLIADEDSLVAAELLVLGSVPLSDVALIGVANDRSRDKVRDLLAGSGFEPKISVYPPWFTA